MNAAVEFKEVDILFAQGSGRARREALRRALVALDAGGNRTEIAAATGVVIGVAGVNHRVERGEVCVLMGLSGSGKSTLIRAVNGLNTVSRGQVLVRLGEETIDAAHCTPDALRRLRANGVAMVFQQFALLPWRTVRDNVALGLELRGTELSERLRIVDEKLELVGLAQWADRHANELSGGMQQRVGLARALATDAEILLMDEPFSALDPLIRTKLQDELLELQRQVRKTIIFVSHDLDEALKIGNQIAIMEGGRIVQAGSAEDIVLRPADDYVADFVRHMNPLTALKAAGIMRPLTPCAPDETRLRLACGDHSTIELDLSSEPPAVSDEAGALSLLDAAKLAGPVQPDTARSVVVAPPEATLRDLIRYYHLCQRPVLVRCDARTVGCCGVAEIFDALRV